MKYLFILLIFHLLFSCSSSEKTETEDPKLENNFTISGKIAGAESLVITLEALSQQGSISVAQSTIDKSGNFKMEGNIPGMGIYQLKLGNAPDKIIPLTLVPEDHLKLKTSFAEFSVKPNVSGTEWASIMNGYMILFAEFNSKSEELSKLQQTASEEELAARYMELKKPIDDYSRQKMREFPSNPFNIVLSTSATPTMGFKYWDVENLEVLKLVAEAYKKKYKDSPIAATMENQVFQIESAYNEYKKSESGDQTAPEIALKNPSGKVIKLSSLRGKVVLIDFWASWCGPCRKENPNVIRLYNQYKDKGFTVYSVSLDQNLDAWKQAIANDGLVWPNHVSDLMGWKTPMTQLYGFESIPYTVLIDKEGKIIGTGLRGESLEQKLKEIFSK